MPRKFCGVPSGPSVRALSSSGGIIKNYYGNSCGTWNQKRLYVKGSCACPAINFASMTPSAGCHACAANSVTSTATGNSCGTWNQKR